MDMSETVQSHHANDIKEFWLAKSNQKAMRRCKHYKVTLPYGYELTPICIEHDFGYGAVETTWRMQAPPPLKT